ncbi:hypothetical protein ACIRPH_31345 [Nocardiopsis sp. NPDC101807]|uniref:hypothetical protein n=1 Tax=Nocardiopsis sp. NPDC101807 TaxID=3364339 RepID=UPI003829624D
MTTPIAPIETTYANTRFRSRLEARWAVFFDHLNVKWLYEPEGYILGNGDQYLPDFWLPGQQVWVEVKGAPTSKDMERLRAATAMDGLPVVYGDARRPCDVIDETWPAEIPGHNRILLLGNIPDPNNTGLLCGWLHWMTILDANGSGLHTVFRDVGAPTEWIYRPLRWKELESFDGVTGPTALSWAETTAYLAARSARFEHGESGCTLEQCVLCPCGHERPKLVCDTCWPRG